MRPGDAFKAFFILLGSSSKADQLAAVLHGDHVAEDGKSLTTESSSPQQAETVQAPPKSGPKPAAQQASPQSEAITLLTALQREARFIDFIKESLQGYSPQEIGAACLAVHDDAAAVLERFFAIRPLSTSEEGQSVTVEESNPAKCTLSGNISETFPVSGLLVHAGWTATKCDLPKWSGDKNDAAIIAPFEIEVK
ncbi:MAG: DUF2760 domain-containing protein [Thermoguttaceae bacterium]|nr:DUF2760 domain-containing protein [Thermoguttaceae bacterium]